MNIHIGVYARAGWRKTWPFLLMLLKVEIILVTIEVVSVDDNNINQPLCPYASVYIFVSDIAVFVLKSNVKLQPTNLQFIS